MKLAESLAHSSSVVVRQKKEIAELLGFETRNKYEIAGERGETIGYCAEQQKGLFGFLARQLLGHWRTFELHFFDTDRSVALRAFHPFRWFFQCLEVSDGRGALLGRLQQRFAIFTKTFDVLDPTGRLVLEMRSGFLSFWTFPVTRPGSPLVVAVIRKQWGGVLKELFTDADTFQLEFTDPGLTAGERQLLLAAAVFVDLQYFENKGGGGLGLLDG